MRRTLGQPWCVYLVLGTAAVGVYYVIPWNSPGQTFVYDGIGISSSAAVLWGALSNRPAQRLPWCLFAARLLAFAIGDSIFNVYADFLHRNRAALGSRRVLPFPGVEDNGLSLPLRKHLPPGSGR